MNIQAYIESGILEEYVLGNVSPQEKQEVECMSHIYPEIKEELLRTESALEAYALKHQTPPPPSLKEALFAQMNFEINERAQNAPSSGLTFEDQESENTSGIAVSGTNAGETTEVAHVLGKEVAREITPLWAKMAAAASVILAIFAGWSAVQMFGMKTDMKQMTTEMNGLKKNYDYAQSLAGLYRNPEYKTVRLAGLEKSPGSSVAAFWNQVTNEVLLDVQSLPVAPAGKQYQLWSIVDGVPVDIGMLDQEFSGKVLKMKNTKAGSVAFAITLEKEGGNPTPTMEEMYVMGKV
jgi:anti-sigma-K factor RskA